MVFRPRPVAHLLYAASAAALMISGTGRMAHAGFVTWSRVVGDPTFKSSRALLIGIDDYRHTASWPRLNNAVADADAVADELREHGYEISVLKNPRGEDLAREIKEFFILSGNDPEGRLLLWFAGHGHLAEGAHGWLVPVDGPSSNDTANFRFTALSMEQVKMWMRQAQAKHVLAVIDACFAGAMFGYADHKNEINEPSMGLTAYQIITSGGAEQKVTDGSEFREEFIKLIRGEGFEPAHRAGYVATRATLGQELRDRVPKRLRAALKTVQTPDFGFLSGKPADGDYFFAPKKLEQFRKTGTTTTAAHTSTNTLGTRAAEAAERLKVLGHEKAPRRDFEAFVAAYRGTDSAIKAQRYIDDLNEAETATTKAMHACLTVHKPLAGGDKFVRRLETQFSEVIRNKRGAHIRGVSVEDKQWEQLVSAEELDGAIRLNYGDEQSWGGVVKLLPVGVGASGTVSLVGVQSPDHGVERCLRLNFKADGHADGEAWARDEARPVGRSFVSVSTEPQRVIIRLGTPPVE